MRYLLALLLMIIFSKAPICAQNSSDYWTKAKAPWGGEVLLTQVSSGILYAQHNLATNAIYRSNDAGAHWEQLTYLEQNTNIYFSPSGGQFVIGKAGRFYYKSNVWMKSVNEGISWTPLSNNTSDFFKLIETETGTLIGYGNEKLFRSVDGGQTWSQTYAPNIDFNGSSINLETLPDGSVVLKVNGDFCHIIRSTDDGHSWTIRDFNGDYELQMITPAGAYILYNTSGPDNLVNELVRQNGPFDPVENVGEFLPLTGYHMLNSGRILISTYEELFFSDDDGLTWTSMMPTDGGSFFGLIPSVELPDGSFFCNVVDALHKSSDGGQHMSFSAVGINKPLIQSIQFLSDSSYLVSTKAGIWKTDNAGQTWDQLEGYDYGSGTFTTTPTGGIITMHDEKILYSPQGNNEFTDISPTTTGYFGSRMFYDPTTNAIFINWVKSGASGLNRSLDYGQSWQYIPIPYTIISMAFHPSGVILANTQSKLYTSTNGGLQWSATDLSGISSIVSLWTSPDGTVYLIGRPTGQLDYRLWRSDNAGATWTIMPGLPSDAYYAGLNFTPNGHIYYADHNKVYGSFNRGVTWQQLPQYTPEGPVQYLSESYLKITPGQKLYLICYRFINVISQNSVINGAFVEGQIKVDADTDCSTDDGQAPFKNVVIEAEGDNYSYYTNTDEEGKYLFFIDTGTYEIKPKVPNGLWWDLCNDSYNTYLDQPFERDTADFTALALAECPLISVEVGVPFLRRCFNNEVYVKYCNQGTETADSAWVDVMLDPFMNFVSSSQPHAILGNNTVRFFVGDVSSGDCGQFQLTAYVSCDSTILGQTHCITAHGFPDTLCFTINNWSGAEIQASVACQDSLVLFKLENVGSAPSQTLDYIIIEDDVVMIQGNQNYNPGQFIELPVPANGHTYRIESEQEPGHPFSTLALAFEEGCGGYESLGFINQFSVNGRRPSWHTICEENTGSYDPNDKHGYPIGVGEDHRILPGQPIEYLIRFQNTGTDTAFTVVIRDTLSAQLDPSTLVLGSSSHSYTWQLEGAGILTFTFENINLPDSSVNWESSQGFIRFRIGQKPDLPTGTKIYNRAGIYFDFNEPVMTNKTWHTVGFPDVTDAHEPAQELSRKVQVMPNPAVDMATFLLRGGERQARQLVLYDPLGAAVGRFTFDGNQLEIPRRNMPAGAYRWVLKSSAGEALEYGILVFQ